jgi:hypothetical protein
VPASNPWVDYVPPSPVPPDSFLFLGANPCHTPASEAQRRESCEKCGGEVVDEAGRSRARAGDADPIKPYETLVVVCVCGRAAKTYEGRLRGRVAAPNLEAVADHTTDRDDPTDRTGAAVAKATPGQPGPSPQPLTRRERRARQFGHVTKTPKGATA